VVGRGCAMRASISLVAAAVLGLAGVAALPVTSSAADASGTVVSVSVDPGPFTVSGFAGQATSRITVVVDDPAGFMAVGSGTPEWDYTGVEAVLVRTSGGPSARVAVDLSQVSLSGTTGTFSGVWRIAATRGGTWTLTDLIWLSLAGIHHQDPRVSPDATQTVTVVASQVPTATWALVPGTVPAYVNRNLPTTTVQRARVTFRTSTGAPIVGATVLWGTEYSCMDPMPPTLGGPRWSDEVKLVTDAVGQVSGKLHLDFGPGQTCVSLLGPPATASDLSTSALVLRVLPYPHMYYRAVSAVPLARSVRVGRTVTIVGSASPLTDANRGVELQRLVGRTWRTIATAPLRSSGRYTVSATLPVPGPVHFRVLAVDPPIFLPTPSRVVTITGRPR